MHRETAIKLVVEELDTAQVKFPEFRSLHEGYAILLEEVDELWEDIKGNVLRKNTKREAIQVAAMAVRLLMDCFKEPE